MLFQKPPSLPLLVCATCRGGSAVGVRVCPECRGMAIGRSTGGWFLYYGEPLTRYHIRLRHARRWLNNFEILGGMIFIIGFLVIFVYQIFALQATSLIWDSSFWWSGYGSQTRYAWLTLFAFIWLLYRLLATDVRPQAIRATNANSPELASPENWLAARKIPRRRRLDLARMYEVEAKLALEQAYLLAEKYKNDTVSPLHLFYALLQVTDIRGVFIRLGISLTSLEAKVAQMLTPSAILRTPLLTPEIQAVLFRAYDIAQLAKQEYVRVTELLLATIEASEILQELLYDLGIDAVKLANVVEWIRVRERLRHAYHSFRRAASLRSKYGLDRAMTAVATPYLNAYSQDITLAAKFGYLSVCVARNKEIDDIFRIIEGGQQSILLVGEAGVGKMSIVEGIAQRMVEEQVPKRLQDKRLVQLSTSALLAGTTVAGAQERLIKMTREIRRAGNVILCINNLHDLMSSTGSAGGEGLDVGETLAECVAGGSVLVLAATTAEGFNQHILRSELGSIFARVEIKEMNENQCIQVLESRAPMLEYKHSVFFSYAALESAAMLAHRFLHDQYVPGSALELATEAASAVRAKRGEHQLVLGNDVAEIVAAKTGIPATAISEAESSKLLRLEELMHERVVGQDEAVAAVANALRRARAAIRGTNRPIANFLFLGPTGVGKTELAKTIAEVYFGGEQQMIRFDMSEFQDTASLYRLIGQPGAQGTGLLTEAVRQHPFSLLLLDELEKADQNILNLFLQVFDDGRLTDSVGRVIDFTNTIIIATSNAGTEFVQASLAQGLSTDNIRGKLIHGELAKYYRPEFLNRFDGIILFRALEREQIKAIAARMLRQVGRDLETRGVELRVEDAALEALADVGFDPAFGARPMRRAIQDRVENGLAQLILENKLERRDVVVLGPDLSIDVMPGAKI